MEKNNLKNIVVLKNLPSNIVDEAILILKTYNKTNKIEVVEKNKKTPKKCIKSNNYVLKEAEMIISSYIFEIEKKEEKRLAQEKLNKKYKRMKKYTVIVSLFLLISIVLNFV